jgi:hypothetical protein
VQEVGTKDEAEQQEDQIKGGLEGRNASSKALVIMYTNAQSMIGNLCPNILLTETRSTSELTDAYLTNLHMRYSLI